MTKSAKETKTYKLKCSGKDIDDFVKTLKKTDVVLMAKKIAEIEKRLLELEK